MIPSHSATSPFSSAPDDFARTTPDLAWLNRISRLMDSQFSIPGTRFRFGLDPILGLIPFAGDAASLVISGTLVLYMARYGASRKLVILMVLNILLDAIVGSIPLLGSVFDFYWKANDRNVRLLREHYQHGRHQGRGTGILIAIGVGLLLLFGALIFGFVKLVEYVAGLF